MRQWIVSTSIALTASVGLVLMGGVFGSASSKDEPKDTRQAQREDANVDAVNGVTTSLLKAYLGADSKGFAAVFTAEGEYLDSKGTVFHGRDAIEQEFAVFFRQTPGTTIEIQLDKIRPLGTNVIAADGMTHFKLSPQAQPVPGRCHLVCVREGDAWRIASLQESELPRQASHHSQVSQLEWLIGEWIGEGPQSHVHFSCRWDDGGAFLIRDFTIIQHGWSTPLSGTQRIGYDPVTEHLKVWTFDSAGGFSEGEFNRDGEAWLLRTSGVTSQGQVASSTNSLTRIDDHRMMSEVTDRSLAGERIKHAEKIVLVRKPPKPSIRSAKKDHRNN